MAAFFSSLRFRLIMLVLLAVIPFLALILHSAAKHRALTAAQVQTNAVRLARVISNEQERFFEGAHQLLISLARLPQVRNKKNGDCSKILAGLLEPLYADLGVVDLKGSILCRALPLRTSRAVESRSFFKRVVETHDFSTGDFRIDPSTGRTIVELGYPVFDPPGLLRAVLFLSLDLSWVTRMTADKHLFPGATFTLLDREGTIIVRYPQAKEWIGKAISTANSVQGILSQGVEGTIDAKGADGVSKFFAFAPLRSHADGVKIYVGIDIPAEEAFAEANRILSQNLISLGLVTTLTLVVAWFGADLFILRRIKDLLAATKRMASETLSARTRLPYGNSELGQLARAFDDLAKALQKREAEAQTSSKQIRQQRERECALNEINLTLTSTLDLTTVLEGLLEKVETLFPSCAAMVSLWNPQTGALEVAACRHLGGKEWMDPEVGVERGLPNIVLESKSPLAVSNAQIDPRTTNPEFFRRHCLFAYLGLPMVNKGENLGVLSFYTKEGQGFSLEAMDFLAALSNQAAIAIYNSRLYEQTRKQATELAKSNKIKDEFLGVMSHELRTPLNVIMNYAEALTMGMFGKVGREPGRGVEKIKSQASQLLALINGVLEITKIETETVSVRKEVIDLNAFLAELQSDYMMPMEKDLTLQWEAAPNLPLIVTDRTKLKQILNNLINNAIKFTDKGTVTLSIRGIEGGGTVEFNVIDTGPGISEEMMPLIFEKFHQIDSTMTRNFSGAGLGLYIVKSFTELLDGTVRVQSKIEEGSVFTVRLPTKSSDGEMQKNDRHFDAQQDYLI